VAIDEPVSWKRRRGLLELRKQSVFLPDLPRLKDVVPARPLITNFGRRWSCAQPADFPANAPGGGRFLQSGLSPVC